MRPSPSRTIAAIRSSSSTTRMRSLITPHPRGRRPPEAGLRAAGERAGRLDCGSGGLLHSRIVPPDTGERGAVAARHRRPRRGDELLDHLPRPLVAVLHRRGAHLEGPGALPRAPPPPPPPQPSP